MTTHVTSGLSRRAVLTGGALTVAFALPGVRMGALAQAGREVRVLDPKQLDAFLRGCESFSHYGWKIAQAKRLVIP
jgi:hypothetical protein